MPDVSQFSLDRERREKERLLKKLIDQMDKYQELQQFYMVLNERVSTLEDLIDQARLAKMARRGKTSQETANSTGETNE